MPSTNELSGEQEVARQLHEWNKSAFGGLFDYLLHRWVSGQNTPHAPLTCRLGTVSRRSSACKSILSCEADILNPECTSLADLRSLLLAGERRTACSLKSVDQFWERDLQLLREGEEIGFVDSFSLTRSGRGDSARAAPRIHKKESSPSRKSRGEKCLAYNQGLIRDLV
jgi:hypothetical protein